jgi:hypothetical protein
MGNLLGMYVSAIIGIFCFIFSFHIAVIISTFLIAKNRYCPQKCVYSTRVNKNGANSCESAPKSVILSDQT